MLPGSSANCHHDVPGFSSAQTRLQIAMTSGERSSFGSPSASRYLLGRNALEPPPRPRIIVADDHRETAISYSLELRDRGFSATPVTSPRELFEKLRHYRFDLLILDMRFGPADGLQLLRRLRHIGLTLPVVIVTGFATEGLAEWAVRCGADAFVSKPVLDGTIVAIVDRQLMGIAGRRASAGASGASAFLRRLERELLDESGSEVWLDFPSRGEALKRHVARACATVSIDANDFITLASILRLMTAAPEDLLSSHAPLEIREALHQPPWARLVTSHNVVQIVLGGLSSGDRIMLSRTGADWGSILSIHPSHLGRLVYTHAGRSLRDLRRVYRLKYAASHLATTNEQIAQIAFRVGFEHSQTSQFSREFHALMGMTPLAFRELSTPDRVAGARRQERNK